LQSCILPIRAERYLVATSMETSLGSGRIARELKALIILAG
jgi:hypothetical protein